MLRGVSIVLWDMKVDIPEMLVAAPRRERARVENFILNRGMNWLDCVKIMALDLMR